MNLALLNGLQNKRHMPSHRFKLNAFKCDQDSTANNDFCSKLEQNIDDLVDNVFSLEQFKTHNVCTRDRIVSV